MSGTNQNKICNRSVTEFRIVSYSSKTCSGGGQVQDRSGTDLDLIWDSSKNQFLNLQNMFWWQTGLGRIFKRCGLDVEQILESVSKAPKHVMEVDKSRTDLRQIWKQIWNISKNRFIKAPTHVLEIDGSRQIWDRSATDLGQMWDRSGTDLRIGN